MFWNSLHSEYEPDAPYFYKAFNELLIDLGTITKKLYIKCQNDTSTYNNEFQSILRKTLISELIKYGYKDIK